MQLVDWHNLFVNLFEFGASTLTVSLLEKIIRPIVIYLVLVIFLKKFGKRILAQLNPFDLVVLLTLSNTVQNAIIGNDTSLSGGIIGAVSLLAVNALLVRIFYRGSTMDVRVRKEEEGDIYLVQNYCVIEPALQKLQINLGELTAKAHERGFDDLDEVETAVLYPNGTIYMKGASADSARISEILQEVQALRREMAGPRH
jgi:uncharacterized membrane protein YcaP (DUF421 family)